MKTTITRHEFIDTLAFQTAFSYEARAALFDYFEEYEDSTGEELDFDPVAIRCEFVEYANIAEYWGEYGREQLCLDDIRDYTTVVEIDNESFLIVAY